MILSKCILYPDYETFPGLKDKNLFLFIGSGGRIDYWFSITTQTKNSILAVYGIVEARAVARVIDIDKETKDKFLIAAQNKVKKLIILR
jgi:hypothetical protein